MHALTREIMHSSAPSDWWADYGGSMKELQQLKAGALRLLARMRL